MKNRSFGFLWAGQSLYLFGDVFYIVALIILLYHQTGSALFTAIVPIFRVGPVLISGILAPLLVDRFHLKRILVFSQLVQVVLFLGLLLYCLYGLSRGPLFIIYLFVCAISFLEGWTVPSRNSLVPRLVPPDRLVKANGQMATTDQTVQFVGWAVGGSLVAVIGAQQTMWLTFGLFVLSLTSMFFIQDRSEAATPVRTEQERPRGSMREGWVTIGQMATLRTIMTMEVVEGIANGAWMGAILLVYVHETLHRGDQWWGFINASWLGGAILGGLLVLTFSRWMERRLGAAILIGPLLFGLFTLWFGYTTIPWLALLLALLTGPAGQAKDVAKRTMFQQQVDNTRLPKVFSAHATVTYTTFGISAFIMAPIADHFGVKLVFALSAILYGISVCIGFWNRKAFAAQQEQKIQQEENEYRQKITDFV